MISGRHPRFSWRFAFQPPRGGGTDPNLPFYLRALAGAGDLYPWPVTILIGLGLALGAWKTGPARRIAGLAGGLAILVVGMQSLFFWQGTRFLLLALPPLLAAAALPIAGPWALRAVALGLLLAASVSLVRTPQVYAPDHAFHEPTVLREIAAVMPPNAALLAHTNGPFFSRLVHEGGSDRVWVPLGMDAQEFSIAWYRLKPYARVPDGGAWVRRGLDFSRPERLIDALLAEGRPVFLAVPRSDQVPRLQELLDGVRTHYRLVPVATSSHAPLYRVVPAGRAAARSGDSSLRGAASRSRETPLDGRPPPPWTGMPTPSASAVRRLAPTDRSATISAAMPHRPGVLAVACVLLRCVVEAHAGVPRTELLLNGRWEVRAGDPDRGPLGPWQPVRVPEPIVPDPNRREATYRLRFPLPRDVPRGRDALLTFAMAGHHARVVLNGKELGEHYGIRLPFSFDVTHVLRPGADNELVVVTHVADAAHARPGGVASAEEAKAYDIYWTGPPRGGTYPPAIVGDVTLTFVPAVRVEDVFVRTSVRDRTVVVAFEVANHGPAAAHVVARAEVVRLDGTPARVALPEGAVTVRPGRRLAVERSATFPDALPWPDGAPTPPLYVLRTTLTDGQRRVDAVTTRFGVREISTDGRALLLNGRPLRVVGTNTVAIMDRERLAHLFAALRMVGVNAVFLHWSDASDAFYDVADEAGMLVLAELYCSGPPFRWPSPAGRFWADDMRPQYEQWVKLRRNHPSIVLWSAYDMAPTPPLAAAVLDGFGALIRSLDPTRPILHRDVFAVSVGDLKAFVADPNARRVYDDALARSQMANRPLLVHEVVGLDALSATELERFRAKLAADGVVGWGGLQIETALFRARAAEVSWPSLTGRDGRLPPEGGRAVDVVNWSDPGQPAFTVAELGDRLAGGPDRSDTVVPAVLRFQRSPELLVLVPAALGGRAFALATPVAGAGAIERGTLVDGAGTGWLVLTEPGTYRVQATDAGVAAKTVTAMPTDFDPAPGWAHVERVALTP